MNACSVNFRTANKMADSSGELNTKQQLSEGVCIAIIETTRKGFIDASMSGLSSEGAMEAAVSTIQKLDIEKIIEQHHRK